MHVTSLIAGIRTIARTAEVNRMKILNIVVVGLNNELHGFCDPSNKTTQPLIGMFVKLVTTQRTQVGGCFSTSSLKQSHRNHRFN